MKNFTKKMLSLLLLVAMLLSMLAACSQPPQDGGSDTDAPTETEAETEIETEASQDKVPTPTPDNGENGDLSVSTPEPDHGESGSLGESERPVEKNPEKPQNPEKTLLAKTKEPYNGGNLGCTGVTLLAEYNRGVDFDIDSVQDYDNKIHRLYLPCRADLSSVTFMATHRDGSQSGPYTADFSDEAVSENEVFIGSASQYALQVLQSDLPTVMIEVDETYGTVEAMNKDSKHETYTYGAMVATVTDAMAMKKGWQTRYASADEDASSLCSMKMRGRGNGTWVDAKKPYQFVTENSLNLFGMGSARKYLLLANYNDAAGLRTPLSLTMGGLLGIPHTTDYQQVDVFLNGKYLGMYTLAEKVEADESRVAIDRNDDILFEIDNYATKEPEFAFQTDYSYSVHKWRGYRVHSPEKDAVMDKAKTIIAAAETAILSGNDAELAKYFDLESWAKMYFVQMYTMNSDAFGASLYFYYNHEDGKLYACSPWDFDWSFGVSHRNTSFWVDPLQYDVHSAHWIREMITYESFVVAVLDEYYENGAREVIASMPALVDVFAKEFCLSGKMNLLAAPTNLYPDSVTDYDSAVAYVKDVSEKRVRFMASLMADLDEKYSYFAKKKQQEQMETLGAYIAPTHSDFPTKNLTVSLRDMLRML